MKNQDIEYCVKDLKRLAQRLLSSNAAHTKGNMLGILAFLEQIIADHKEEVTIEIRGGNVQEVYCPNPNNISVTLIDHDQINEDGSSFTSSVPVANTSQRED